MRFRSAKDKPTLFLAGSVGIYLNLADVTGSGTCIPPLRTEYTIDELRYLLYMCHVAVLNPVFPLPLLRAIKGTLNRNWNLTCTPHVRIFSSTFVTFLTVTTITTADIFAMLLLSNEFIRRAYF